MQPNSVGLYVSELYNFLDMHPELSEHDLLALSDDSDPEKAKTGTVLAAACACKAGKQAKALGFLHQHLQRKATLPIPAFLWMIALRDAQGESEKIPADFLNYASVMKDTPPLSCAAEAVSIAMVDDAKSHLKLIHDPIACQQAAQVYEKIARQLPPVTPRQPVPQTKTYIRIGLVVANLVDHIVAYSNRAVFFARYLNTERYRLFIYSSENMCQRKRILPFPYAAPPSPQTAPEYLKELQQRNITTWLTPRDTDTTTAAVQLAQRITDDHIDILLIQSGTTMPIDWIASFLADIPVKMQIHIGLSALQPGLDATLFDNEKNRLRENKHWPANCGGTRLVRRGTDIDAIDRMSALNRSDFGLPYNAILIGVLSNYLATRISSEYLDAIATVLKKIPNTHFVAIGGSEMPAHVIEFARRKDLLSRIHHIPARHDAPAALKMLDIYASEFPTGGSQAVIEAMACRLPVAAMCVGDTHYESIGADLVGPEAAIQPPTQQAYTHQIIRWASSPAERQAAGMAMRRRAENHFHVKFFVDKVCTIGEEFLATKTKEIIP